MSQSSCCVVSSLFTDSLLKRAEGEQGSEEGVAHYGPLTQRLIAVSGCLARKREVKSHRWLFPQAFLEEPSQERGVSPLPPTRRFSPPVNIPQVQALENRLKEELVALGILEPAEVRRGPCDGSLMPRPPLSQQGTSRGLA